jgi:hypothetical protein
MPVELLITGAAAIATILATYFVWRAVREGKDTVVSSQRASDRVG